MFWTWNIVAHVILLQVAIAFYYLAWPALSKALTWLFRKIYLVLPLPEAPEDAEDMRSGPYRGHWRDAAHQRADTSDHQKQHEWRARQARPISSLKAKHLRVLGLKEPAHLIDIKTAYRSMAMAYHPDRFTSDVHDDAQRSDAAMKMRQINEAYDWLRVNA